MKRKILLALIFLLPLFAFPQKSLLAYSVSMENPAWHYFHVELNCKSIKKDSIDFKMPVWTPGYYQRMDYANYLENFKAFDAEGKELKWIKAGDNNWRVYSKNNPFIKLSYDIKTIKPFVANSYLDETRGYIVPAGLFLHIDKMLKLPVQLSVAPAAGWNQVVTGLDTVAGKPFTYTAADFDILYDNPILIGNLEELPSFKVRGITHRFIGYKLGNFDRIQLMTDLKKIIETSVNTIGDIPYKSYTFIAIGPGRGGIEHLNNTCFSFNGSSIVNRDSFLRTLYFLAHEYFHNYNVKRIRPIELGPFDYDNGSKTKMLWFSEGLSVYYEYLLVKRAGLTTDEELFNSFRNNIIAYERKPGRLFQTLEQASVETWKDGPFGRTEDEVNKTISYYDKGPVVGMLFDFKIRDFTKNKKSLDDVMRFLYKEYYQKKKRGFTDEDLRQAFETVAGTSLAEEFEYITTTKYLDYDRYFSYAGLKINTEVNELPGPYTGFTAIEKEDSLLIVSVDYESPSWNVGIRIKQVILQINNKKATSLLLKQTIENSKPGDKISFAILTNDNPLKIELKVGKKSEKSFQISPIETPSPLQKQILERWLKG